MAKFFLVMSTSLVAFTIVFATTSFFFAEKELLYQEISSYHYQNVSYNTLHTHNIIVLKVQKLPL